MSINIKLFASLAESFGRPGVTLDFVGGMTAGDVWSEIRTDSALPEEVLMAVNMTYCEASTPLHDGDEVAYFPPVTGG